MRISRSQRGCELTHFAGQQALWSEQSGPQNVDPIVWPRAAASAEIFWSAQPGGTPLNVTEALPRLHVSPISRRFSVLE